MKTLFVCMFFVWFCINNNGIYGQTKDTLIISALPPGNLNNIINSDTSAGGEGRHVYLLAPNGEIDTTYFITEEIKVKNLDLIGKLNPNTGNPPVIEPYILADGSSPNNIAVAIDNGYVYFKNLYLLGTRLDGTQVTMQCISTSDSCRLTLENCVIENFGSGGTANILNTWNAIGSDIFVTNCLFRNNQSNIPTNPCMNWAGPGVMAIDTMIVKNSTFFVFGGNIEGSGSSIGYLEFDHNTIFMHTKLSPFNIRQMHNVKITNNIFYSIYSAGLDSMHVYGGGVWSNSYNKPGIIELDSLNESLEGDPYYIIESDRNVEAINNVYYWPQTILDNFETLNADKKYQIVGGGIIVPAWITTDEFAESLLDMPNIQVAEEDNYNIDPGFDVNLVESASDSMARFVRYVWENGGDGKVSKPFVYLSDPNNMFNGVSENWAEIQGYPVRENLSYSNQSLMSAGTDGLPLGDLNWFPEYIVGTQTIPKSLPYVVNLSQNYPNPFNPSTTIKYSIPLTHPLIPSREGKERSDRGVSVALKIYDILGREVATLVNQKQKPGNYEVEWNAAEKPSGVYFYKLQTNEKLITKKMLLLK